MTAKFSFIGSEAITLTIDRQDIQTVMVTFENGFYKGHDVDNDVIIVYLPCAKWADITVRYNGRMVDMNDEYDDIINVAVKKATKMFVNIRL